MYGERWENQEHAAPVANERQDSLVRRWFIDNSTLAYLFWLFINAGAYFRCSKSRRYFLTVALNSVIQILAQNGGFQIFETVFSK